MCTCLCVCTYVCITQIVFGVQSNWLTRLYFEGPIRSVLLITVVRMFHIPSVHELGTE